jgi:Hg(II)-responsive transcriptional regulator
MPLTIGQLANGAGVNLQTVRYYERRGLMAAPARTRSGYRQYPPDALARLRFIKRAQNLGFSLAEIRGLLELRIARPSSVACDRVLAATEAKVALVERKIRELQRLKRSLDRLLAACRARTPTGDCPILQAIESRAREAEPTDG